MSVDPIGHITGHGTISYSVQRLAVAWFASQGRAVIFSY
jgi:hypothetical protein